MVKTLKISFALIFFYTQDIKNIIFNPKFYQHFLPSLVITNQSNQLITNHHYITIKVFYINNTFGASFTGSGLRGFGAPAICFSAAGWGLATIFGLIAFAGCGLALYSNSLTDRHS